MFWRGLGIGVIVGIVLTLGFLLWHFRDFRAF